MRPQLLRLHQATPSVPQRAAGPTYCAADGHDRERCIRARWYCGGLHAESRLRAGRPPTCATNYLANNRWSMSPASLATARGQPACQPARPPASQPASQPACLPANQLQAGQLHNGMRKSTGRPAPQPLKIFTTVPNRHRALDRQSNGGHRHAQVAGLAILGADRQPARQPASPPASPPAHQPTSQASSQPASQLGASSFRSSLPVGTNASGGQRPRAPLC